MHKTAIFQAVCALLLGINVLTAQNSSFSFVYDGPSEIFVGEDCVGVLDWGHPNQPIAMSNVPGGEIISFDIISISGEYSIGDEVPPGSVITILYEARDNYGNSAVFGFNITFVDNIPPTFDVGSLPSDLSVACVGDVPDPAEVTGFDNCMDPEYLFTITLTEESTVDGCTGGVITRTWVADDDLGNQTTYTQTITVSPDTDAPVFTTPPVDGSGACDDAMNLYTLWLNEQRNNQVADDGGCSNISFTDNAPDASVLVGFCGVVPVQFMAADNCGNMTAVTATFSIENSIAPTIETQASDGMANCSSGNPEGDFQSWINTQGGASAFDDCGSVSWTTNPPNPSLGDTCSNMFTIEFIADDGCGNTSSTTASFMAIDTTAPTIDSEPQVRFLNCANDDIEAELSEWLVSGGGAIAQDLCTGMDDLRLSYQIGTEVLDTNGVFQALQDSFLTGCRDGVIVSGISFDQVIAILDLDFIFADACGNEVSVSSNFLVVDNTPPEIDSAAQDLILTCDTIGNIMTSFANWYNTAGGAQASDGCGDVQWNGAPALDVAFDELLMALDTSCTEGANVEVSFFATDFCGNESEFTIAHFGLMDTIPPVVILSSDTLNIGCNDFENIPEPEVVDDCSSSITITFIDSVLTNIDTAACAQFEQMIIRTWSASDVCGNETSVIQTIHLSDLAAPSFDTPPDTIVNCIPLDSIANISYPTNIVDDCDPDPLVIFEDIVNGSGCNFSISRTWMISDACGNMQTGIQNITITDSIAPIIITTPEDLIISCSDSANGLQLFDEWIASNAGAILEDNCSDVTSFMAIPGSYILGDSSTYPGTPAQYAETSFCNNDSITEVALVYYDACLNAAEIFVEFQLGDTIQPEWSNCENSIMALLDPDSCTASFLLFPPDPSDNCTAIDDLVIQYQIDDMPITDIDLDDSIRISLTSGTHQIKWMAKDCNENVGICTTQLIAGSGEDAEVECPSSFEVYLSDTSCTISVDVPLPEVINSTCSEALTAYLSAAGGIQFDSLPFDINDTIISLESNLGISDITYYFYSGGGQVDSCSISLNVLDTISPIAKCKSFSVNSFPTTQQIINIDFLDIDDGSFDQCGIDSFSIFPNNLTCELAGDTIEVELTLFDASGNMSACTASVSIEEFLIEPLFNIDVCNPDTLFLFSNIDYPDSLDLSFSWIGPNEFVSIEENPFIANVDELASGIYEVNISGSGGCEITGIIDVKVESFDKAEIEASDTLVCVGDSVVFTSLSYSDTVMYQWRIVGPDSLSSLIDTTTVPNYTYETILPGNYLAFVTVLGDGCQSEESDTLFFKVQTVPEVNILRDSLVLCFGDSISLSPFQPDSLLIYQWTGPNEYMSSLAQTEKIEVNDQTIGIYYVHASNGTCSAEDSVSISATPRPPAPSVQGDSIFCLGETMTLTADGDDEFSSFSWMGPNGQSIQSDSDTLFIDDFSELDAGEWRVIGVLFGCLSDTSMAFQVALDSSAFLEVLNNGPVCAGQDVQLSIAPLFENGQFNWTGPNKFSSMLENPNVSGGFSGTYYVEFISENGCFVFDSTQVIFNDIPEILGLSSNFEACVEPNFVGQLIPDFVASDSVQFQWESPTGDIFSEQILMLNNLSSEDNGWYQLTLSDNGCTSRIDSFFVDVNVQPVALEIIGPDQLCEGASLNINSNGPLADSVTYIWHTPNGDSIIVGQNSFVLPEITPLNSGAYSVSIQIGACTSERSNQLDITIQGAVAQPTIMAPSKVCEGDDIALGLVGGPIDGATYNWSGPAMFGSSLPQPTIQSATPLATGNYIVSVDIDGCVSPVSNSFFIEVTPRPNAPIIEAFSGGVCLSEPQPIMVCIDEASTISGATYFWSNGDNGTDLGSTTGRCLTIDDFSSFTEGENSFLVEAEVDGCSSFSSPVVSIEMFEFPNETAEAADEIFICVGEEPIIFANPVFQSNGLWSAIDNLIVLEHPDSNTTLVQGLAEGENKLIWSLSYEACLNFSVDTAFVFVEPIPTVMDDTIFVDFGNSRNFNVIINDQLPLGFNLAIVTGPTRGNTLHQGNGDFVYTSNIGFVGEDSFVYRVCSEECPDQCDEATVILKVGDDSDCFVPTLFTPNDDGVNDEWIIPCLEADRFPSNRVVVFNEWGDAVLESEKYLNNWRGTYKGKDLPVGTYYYVVDFGDGSEVRKGFIIIER